MSSVQRKDTVILEIFGLSSGKNSLINRIRVFKVWKCDYQKQRLKEIVTEKKKNQIQVGYNCEEEASLKMWQREYMRTKGHKK